MEMSRSRPVGCLDFQSCLSSIMILEVSFSLINDVYSTGITYYEHQLLIVIFL